MSSTTSTTSTPLAELSPNTTSSSPAKSSAAVTASCLLQPNPDHQEKQTYISPSDTIQSPTTKKLHDLRTKRFTVAAKGQSLFAKTVQREGWRSQDALASGEVGNGKDGKDVKA